MVYRVEKTHGMPCLFQISFCKGALSSMADLWKEICKEKASHGSSQPCSLLRGGLPSCIQSGIGCHICADISAAQICASLRKSLSANAPYEKWLIRRYGSPSCIEAERERVLAKLTRNSVCESRKGIHLVHTGVQKKDRYTPSIRYCRSMCVSQTCMHR